MTEKLVAMASRATGAALNLSLVDARALASFLPATLPATWRSRTAEDAAEPSRGARTDRTAIRTPTRSRFSGDDSRRRARRPSRRSKGGRFPVDDGDHLAPLVPHGPDRSRRRVDGTRRGRARRDGRASSARRGGGRRRNRRAPARRDVRSTRVRRRGFGRRRRGGGDGRIHAALVPVDASRADDGAPRQPPCRVGFANARTRRDARYARFSRKTNGSNHATAGENSKARA